MLFNSYAFLFLFLPVTFLGFFQIGRYSRPLAALWLFAASLFFYGWWNPVYVGLLLASIFFNYAVGMALSKEHAHGHVKRKKMIGWIAVLWALAWLAPNTQQIMANFKPALENVTPTKWLHWQPNKLWLTSIVVCLLYALTEMEKVSEFLYFQF